MHQLYDFYVAGMMCADGRRREVALKKGGVLSFDSALYGLRKFLGREGFEQWKDVHHLWDLQFWWC
jgi:hypothetical protein